MKKLLYLIIIPLIFACSSTHKIRFVRVNKVKSVKNTEINKNVPFLSSNVIERTRTFELSEIVEESFSDSDSIQCSESVYHSDTFSQHSPLISSIAQITVKKEIYTESVHKKLRERGKNDVSIWLAIWGGIVGVFIGLGIVKKKRYALKISHWAKDNKWKSIGLIAGIKLTLGAVGLYAGKIMFDADLLISPTTTYLLLSVVGLTALTYPIKNSRYTFFKHGYLRQKMHDVILSMCGVLLMASIGNQVADNREFSASATSVFSSMKNMLYSPLSLKEGVQNTSAPTKEFQNSKSSMYQKKSSEMSVGVKVLLTLLVLGAVAALAALLALLVCELTCSGQGAAATAVGWIGGIVLVALLILALVAIWRRKNVKQIE